MQMFGSFGIGNEFKKNETNFPMPNVFGENKKLAIDTRKIYFFDGKLKKEMRRRASQWLIIIAEDKLNGKKICSAFNSVRVFSQSKLMIPWTCLDSAELLAFRDRIQTP